MHIHWNSLWSSSYHRNGVDLVRCVYHLITDFQIKNKMIILNIFKEEQDEKEKGRAGVSGEKMCLAISSVLIR